MQMDEGQEALVLEFGLPQPLLEAFMSLTADRNPLHMNDAFARRTRYRRRVVYGMLPLCSLFAVQTLYPRRSVRFARLKGRFTRSVLPGDELCMRVFRGEPEEGTIPFTAVWERPTDGAAVTRVTGAYRLIDPPPTPRTADRAPGSAGLNAHPVAELALDMDALEAQVETLTGEVGPAAIDRIGEILTGMGVSANDWTPCPNLASTLLLSTLVGMRLPGRHATFLGFTMNFDDEVPEGCRFELSGKVARLQPAADLMRADVDLVVASRTVATGSIEALVNPPPTTMPTCDELSSQLDLGLRGRVALIVGGSRGIGETTAKLLALLGARVMLTYFRGQEDAERIVAEIRESGCEADCLPCDVRDDAQVQRMVETTRQRLGGIDIVVNAAVHDFSPSPAIDSTWGDYLEELDVSLKGLHAVCRRVIPLMREAGGGKIVNFSSVVTRNPVTGQSRYITAKSAVEGYTRSLARELAGSNIQVNVIIPNMTETDLVASIPTNYRHRLGAARDYRRHVAPAEVAQGVAYLASQWSNAMTGQALVLNLGEPPYT